MDCDIVELRERVLRMSYHAGVQQWNVGRYRCTKHHINSERVYL